MFKMQVTPHPPFPTASTWVAAPPPPQQKPGSFSHGESKTEVMNLRAARCAFPEWVSCEVAVRHRAVASVTEA